MGGGGRGEGEGRGERGGGGEGSTPPGIHGCWVLAPPHSHRVCPSPFLYKEFASSSACPETI